MSDNGDLTRIASPFQVISDYVPAGDQPQAIEEIAQLTALESAIKNSNEVLLALITETELKLMAAAAIIGLKSNPNTG